MAFEISLSEEQSNDSSSTPEERATFGQLNIDADGAPFAAGFDHHLDRVQSGPLVSGAPLAEWLAWNWWRLAYEPWSSDRMWGLAHDMTSAGEGYTWPKITIFSDGERTAVISRPSEPGAKPYSYYGADPVVFPASQWRAAVDEFMAQVTRRLSAAGLDDANALRLWNDISAERNDPDTHKFRRLQAMMGQEPDEDAGEAAVEGLINAAARLGEKAVEEVAAGQSGVRSRHRPPMTVEEYEAVSARDGIDANARNGAAADNAAPGVDHNIPAWRAGADAARALRRDIGNTGGLLENRMLADLAGAPDNVIEDEQCSRGAASFYLSGGDGSDGGRLVLRQHYPESRRFDLARIIGDRLCYNGDNLLPATKARTYRQKLQRAFAGELLCPFEVIDDRLAGDCDDDEQQEEAAREFKVSPFVIRTQLMNYGRIERGSAGRDDPDTGVHAAAA